MPEFSARLRAALRALSAGPADFQDEIPEHVARIVARVRPYTMTSLERIWSLVEAVRYLVRARVPGALVECGVWKGGSALAVVLALQELNVHDRDVYLYDTFEGMPKPGEQDTTPYAEPALKTWRDSLARAVEPFGDFFSREMYSEAGVAELLSASGYPKSRVHIVKGPVERTLPQEAPSQLALLRLDTDWYASTRHELEVLYPRLAQGGVLIVDDYGHWDGCRRAVDEYFASGAASPVLLQRIDYTARIAVKC